MRISQCKLLLFITASSLLFLTRVSTKSQRSREVLLDKISDQNYCSPSAYDTCCESKTVEKINDSLVPLLRELVRTHFFKYYKLKLYKECPFWKEYGQCMNEACAVETTDETNVPEMWRSNVLGALHTSRAGTLFQPFKRCEYTDQDFCVVEDEADSEGVFVNLIDNPERFTGYAGTSASRVWKSVYEENCFNIVDPASNNFAISPSKSQLGNILQNVAQKSDATDIEEVCFEKRVYYRLISGLHSSISLHICDEYLNQTTGQWGPNLECFITRVGSHPERLQNVYFGYTVLLRAISKAADYLKGYNFCAGDKVQDSQVKTMVSELVNAAGSCSEKSFDEKQMFASSESHLLKEEFKSRFRNVSRIMDCVGCDKCRLWGKLQISGLGTALKVLFSYDDEYFNPKVNPNLLTRTEIVALFNTFNRFSESLTAIQRFRQMYQKSIRDIDEPINNEESSKLGIETDTKSRVTSKNTTNQQTDSLSEEDNEFIIEFIVTIKNILSSYIIKFYRIVIQQLEYWNIPVPVLLKSITS